MDQIPWFAWIPILAIIAWGIIQSIQAAKSPAKTSVLRDQQLARINDLERRIEQLERDRPSGP